MKIGLIEMMSHDMFEKVADAKAAVLEWDAGAFILFSDGDEYQRALDELRAAGAIDRQSGEANRRAFICLDLPPQPGNAVAWLQQEFDIVRTRNIELKRDNDIALKTAMRAESELQEALTARRQLEDRLRDADRQYHELSTKQDEARRLLRQTEEERNKAIKRGEFSDEEVRRYQTALTAELGKIPDPVWYGLFEGHTLIQVEAFTFRPAVADFSQNCDGIMLRGDKVSEVKIEPMAAGAEIAA